jgi:hypothetical protein
MSQGDYIRFKKLSAKLRNVSNKEDFPQVLQSQDFTNYLEYSVLNMNKNTKTTYQLLNTSTNSVIFDMKLKDTSTCSTLICPKINGPAGRRVNQADSTGFLNGEGMPVVSAVRKFVKHPVQIHTAKCSAYSDCIAPTADSSV